MTKIFIIAGEVSGDLQAAKLIKEMNKINSQIQWQGIGGDLMVTEGLQILKHMKQMAFMGFVEVIKHLPEIFKNIQMVKQTLLKDKPTCIILIDYPGFNLKIAKIAKELGIKVFYYITPQLWAWHESRVYKMQKYVDYIINIFPFEVDFYNKYNIKSYYFGHPLLEGLKPKFESITSFKTMYNIKENCEIISLLPGSRISEVSQLMPIFLESIEQYQSKNPSTVILLSKVNYININYYGSLEKIKNLKIVESDAYSLMAYSDFVIIASGTATLETACLLTPMIVCYKTNSLTYSIAKFLVKIKYISLVNIIFGSKIVPELIQNKCNSYEILKEIQVIKKNRKSIVDNLKTVKSMLDKENVSKNVAQFILSKI